MIKEREGDALKSGADILAHQTNCVGVMGAGIAKQIKDQLISKEDYNIYRSLCKNLGSDLLGSVQYIKVNAKKEEFCETPQIVANVFGENVPSMNQVDTDYDALRDGLQTVHDYALDGGYSVCVPGLMGCGLAGGDWNIVKGILEDIFEDSEVELTIMYFDGIPQKDKPKNVRCFGSFR